MAAAIPSKVSKWVDVAVSLGAALVIWGALRKILHESDADLWLKIGLSTEAIIFLLYGVLYIIFPALPDNQHSEEQLAVADGSGKIKVAAGGSVSAMDKALAQSQLTPEVFNRLGENFKKLNETVGNMGKIADVVSATADYTTKTREVAATLDKVKDAYLMAASSTGSFNEATAGAKQFHDQVQVLTKNLSSLNTIYELELQESNNHLKALNSFYGKLNEASSVMVKSAEDAKNVQQQIGALSNNLGKLNTIYGNMLTAMSGK